MAARLSTMLAPLTRLEPPGWGRILRTAGVYDDARWSTPARRVVRGKLHGLLMDLDLSDPTDRSAFFIGRYFELGVQQLLHALLSPGDTFVDVGANVGHLTLLAAARVGPSGRVVAFEPNPRAFERLCAVVEMNRLEQVEARRCALGRSAGELTLRVVDAMFMGTLRPVDGAWSHVDEAHAVEVAPGDDALSPELPGAMAVKIDVEGFESEVLAGLSRVLEERRPALILEVNDGFLRAAGSSAAGLFDGLVARGYLAFDLGESGRSRFRELRLRPLERATAQRSENLFFLHGADGRAERLSRWIR